MKDILEAIAKYFPRYARDVGRLLCRPKKFLATRIASSDKTFRDALLFVTVSGALVVLATAPMVRGDQDVLEYLVARLLQLFIAVPALALLLRGTWHLVGGRAPLVAFFEICAYLAGVAVLIFALFEIVAEGCLKLDPTLHARMQAPKTHEDLDLLYSSGFGRVYLGVSLAGFLFVVGWLVVGWGAFRQIAKVSKIRSVFVFIVTMPVALAVAALVFLLGIALSRWTF